MKIIEWLYTCFYAMLSLDKTVNGYFQPLFFFLSVSQTRDLKRKLRCPKKKR